MATTRLPALNSASSTRCASSGTSVQRSRTASGAPLVMRSRWPLWSASTDTQRRSWSKGAMATRWNVTGRGWRPRRVLPTARRRAGCRPPRCPPVGVASLHTRPSVSTSVLSSPAGSIARSKLMWPSVSVPVLSVNSTSMSPRSSMHTSRLTSTFFVGEPPRSGGQAGRHDRGQQLRGDADRDGEREQHRVDDRAAEGDVDHEDRDAEHAADLGQQPREAGEAELELGLGMALAEPDGDPPELGRGARWPPPRRRRLPRARPFP